MKIYIYISIVSVILLFSSCAQDGAVNLTTNPTGKGGSMARFALSQNYLYVVDYASIQVYELKDNGAASLVRNVQVGFGIETIFVRGEDLFLGANDAMYIYSITDRSMPQFISRYTHITSCDPVVVNNNFAYVTLRISENCRLSGSDALEIIDISNKSNPILIKSYSTQSPYGLGIDNNTLFLCEGKNGLKIFNAENPKDITLLKHYGGIHAYDVIPNFGTLILTGDDGIFQYDYRDLSSVTLLSHIPVE